MDVIHKVEDTHLIQVRCVHLRSLENPIVDICIRAEVWPHVVRHNEENIGLCKRRYRKQKKQKQMEHP